jgi:hypothetical protein
MPMQLPTDPEAARVVSIVSNSGLPLRARKGILAALAGSRRDSYRIGHDPKIDGGLTEARLAALTQADLIAQANCGAVSTGQALAWLNRYFARAAAPNSLCVGCGETEPLVLRRNPDRMLCANCDIKARHKIPLPNEVRQPSS